MNLPQTMPFVISCFLVALFFLVSPDTTAAADSNVVEQLRKWLSTNTLDTAALETLPFASSELSRTEADAVTRLLWQNHAAAIRSSRLTEMTNKVIELHGKRMPFDWLSFTNSPQTNGRSLFISLHGGGGAPARVNDQQWKNQIQLGKRYKPSEGIYVAPRAPGDSWDLWHKKPIDEFFARLIENFVVFENVNPNRVYLMGYSAGGDGVYQVAPRLADRFAAASMMAGHPNEASPIGLRNLPFSIQVGGNDAAYNRNKIAADWAKKLEDLQAADPSGYTHFVEIHEGKGHWMDMQDQKAIPWMEKFTRNPLPTKIAWYQDDVLHDRFYWLARPKSELKPGQLIRAEIKAQQITIQAEPNTTVIVLLNDHLLDLNKPITIRSPEKLLFQGPAKRHPNTIARTLTEYTDTNLTFSAEITVKF